MPAIEHREDDVAFTAAEAARRASLGGHDSRIAQLITTLVAVGLRQAGETYQVFLLSAVDDPATIHLDAAIVNDTVAASGRPWAWTMGQRYVSLTRLTAPDVAVTSDLEST